VSSCGGLAIITILSLTEMHLCKTFLCSTNIPGNSEKPVAQPNLCSRRVE
jgi:hypothetical protein